MTGKAKQHLAERAGRGVVRGTRSGGGVRWDER
jgi:hypothetical protein